MMPKVVFPFEQLSTSFANKGGYISVRVFMGSQGGSAYKGFPTVSTFIWSLSSMYTTYMIGQGLGPGIFFITFVTVVCLLRGLWKLPMSLRNTFL